MTSSLVLNERYPHSPERVWQALTNPKSLAVWLMDNNFEPCVGHRFQFWGTALPGMASEFKSEFKSVIDCEVIALEPPSRLVYTWQAPGTRVPSIVTWMLTPIEGGTQVQLHHSGVNENDVDNSGWAAVASPFSARFLSQTQVFNRLGEQQQTQMPHTMPGYSDVCVQSSASSNASSNASVISPTVFLEMMTEDDWRQRLQKDLPRFLNQLVTV